jgi:hypothetical protein
VDTLNLAAAEAEHAQSLRGVRTSTVIGDTVVDGRLLWRIADSSDATIMERFFEDELSYGQRVMIERRVSGTIRSQHLYDPALRLSRTRVDTAALSGSATLRYPDGRSFTSPVRFDRVRESILHTVQSHIARVAALRLAPEVSTDRGLGAASSDLANRVLAGDAQVIDSLAAAFGRSADPVALQRAQFPRPGRGGGSPLSARLNDIMIRAGDTATLVFETLSYPQRWDIATLRDLLIPIAADPAAAFAYGIPRDLFYTTAVRRFIVNPPALYSDSASWGFPPAGVDVLAELGRSARGPRLRDVGVLCL